MLTSMEQKPYNGFRMTGNSKQKPIRIDPLLRKIQRNGWSERLAARFEKEYGRRLRWRIVLHMEKLGLLQIRVSPERVGILSTQRLELFENTLSDLWLRLLDGLIPSYIERVKEGKIHREFIPYLSGVIKHLVIANAQSLKLIGKETPAEIMRSICDAKQNRTRRARIAWAKFCFDHRVRRELLHSCPGEMFALLYHNIHHVVDYFFERFIPAQCSRLAKLKGRVLESLLDSFVESDSEFEEALGYIGTMTPFGIGEEVHTPRDSEMTDDEFLSALQQASQRGYL